MNTIRKTQAAVSKSTPMTHMRVVKDVIPTKREIRIEQFWQFCQAALWSTREFNYAEIKEFKMLIGEHFKRNQNPDKVFKQLVERACLAKRYISRKNGRYISKPVDWLNINYKNGLIGTKGWYKEVQEQRKTVLHYNEGIALFAQAVYSYCDSRNILGIDSFRKEMIRLRQYDLLQMYTNTIIQIQYFN